MQRACRRDRRQGRYPGQHRRAASQLRDRARRGIETAQRRDGHQLLRPAAAGAGVRAGDERARGRRPTHAAAWVNLLSIFALGELTRRTAPISASKAAAYSLAQCLRAEMRPAGIRVINVFPGPIDDEWNQTGAAAEARARRTGRRDREGARRARSRTFIRATSRRNGSRAGATIPKVLERELVAVSHMSVSLLTAELGRVWLARAASIRVSRRSHADAVAATSRRSCCRRRWASAGRFASRRSRATTTAGRAGTGTISPSASTPAPISTRRSTGSPAATWRTMRPTPCRPSISSRRPASSIAAGRPQRMPISC